MENNKPVYTYQLAEGITTDRHGMLIIENEGILDIISKKKLVRVFMFTKTFGIIYKKTAATSFTFAAVKKKKIILNRLFIKLGIIFQ